MKNERVLKQLMRVVTQSDTEGIESYEFHDQKLSTIQEDAFLYGNENSNKFDFEKEWLKALTSEQLLEEVFEHIRSLPWKL